MDFPQQEESLSCWHQTLASFLLNTTAIWRASCLRREAKTRCSFRDKEPCLMRSCISNTPSLNSFVHEHFVNEHIRIQNLKRKASWRLMSSGFLSNVPAGAQNERVESEHQQGTGVAHSSLLLQPELWQQEACSNPGLRNSNCLQPGRSWQQQPLQKPRTSSCHQFCSQRWRQGKELGWNHRLLHWAALPVWKATYLRTRFPLHRLLLFTYCSRPRVDLCSNTALQTTKLVRQRQCHLSKCTDNLLRAAGPRAL